MVVPRWGGVGLRVGAAVLAACVLLASAQEPAPAPAPSPGEAPLIDQYVTLTPPPEPDVCAWSEWGEWSACSRDCGQGTRTRFRTKTKTEYMGGACPEDVDDPTACTAQSLIRAAGGVCTSRDVEPCNGGAPVATEYDTYTGDDDMVPLFPFPSCALGLGQTADTETGCVGWRPCPVDCKWTAWSAWSDCSAECGQNGVQFRTREVAVSPSPEFFYDENSESADDTRACELDTINATHPGGDKHDTGYPCGEVCVGDNIEWRPCFRKECPVNCEWSEWSSWTSCSKLCGGGTQMRTRYVKQQPQHGGYLCTPTACDGASDAALCGSTHTRKCNPESCEYARLHSKQDDFSKDQDLCQFHDPLNVHCPATISRDGGHLTAVGADPRPNDPVKNNCIAEAGHAYDNCETF